MGFHPHGSLITSGAQSLYMTFMTFSAQLSGESACNSAISQNGIFTIELSVGFTLLMVVLLYLTFANKDTRKNIPFANHLELNPLEGGANNMENQDNQEKKKKKKKDNNKDKSDSDKEDNESDEDDDEEDGQVQNHQN